MPPRVTFGCRDDFQFCLLYGLSLISFPTDVVRVEEDPGGLSACTGTRDVGKEVENVKQIWEAAADVRPSPLPFRACAALSLLAVCLASAPAVAQKLPDVVVTGHRSRRRQ